MHASLNFGRVVSSGARLVGDDSIDCFLDSCWIRTSFEIQLGVSEGVSSVSRSAVEHT